MKKTLFLLAFLALAGCAKPLPYEEVKAREKWCTDHSMRPVYDYYMQTRRDNGTNQINSVRCVNDRGQVFDPSRQGPQ